MSLFTGIAGLFAPKVPSWTTANGIEITGTVAVMPDGTQGTYDPATQIITLADGTDVAGHYSLNDPANVEVSTSPPVDLTLIGDQIKAKIKWTGIVGVVGAAVGAGIGFSLAGPVGARVGAAVVGALGAFIGYEEG